MGLRRTPPPGMAAPPPSSSRDNYMTEFPEQQLQEQPQSQVQVEATPSSTPMEATAETEVQTSQVQSSSQVTGTPVDADGDSAAPAAASSTPIDSSTPVLSNDSTGTPISTPTPARVSPPIKSAPPSKTPTPPPPATATAAQPTPRAPSPSPQATPQRNLLTLAAGLNRPPTTPHLRPHPSTRRTPGAHRLAPKLTARSPHAIRAFSRRAATPGRRKSMRNNAPARESPRNLLLKLSGILAPTTEPFVPTPVPTPRVRENQVLYHSDPEEERPSTEVNFYEDGDEDGALVRPEDASRSVERGRRAISEQPWGGRASFGITWDDRFADLDALREQVGDEEEAGNTTVGDVSMGVGDVTLGASSVGNVSISREAMAFAGEEGEEEEADVTMGLEQEELPFDEGDSYFIPLPAGDTAAAAASEDPDQATVADTDEDTDDEAAAPLPDYSDDFQFDLGAASSSAPRPATATATKKKRTKALPLSRHGHPLPPFPRAAIKKLAQKFAGGAAINNETLDAIVKASDAFFEQVSEDLAAYAGHAGRKTVDVGDVAVLMGRQRQTGEGATLFSLAQRHLPRELLQEVRMPLVKPARAGGRKRKGKAVEADADAGGGNGA